MKYIYNNNGVIENVDVERWAWGCVMKDGSERHQFDAQGVFHRVGELDQDSIKLWVLYKIGTENKRIDIVLPAGARIIHKYKRYGSSTQNADGTITDNGVQTTVYVFGYKLGNTYHYNYIMPDDTIIQSNEDIPLSEFGVDRFIK